MPFGAHACPAGPISCLMEGCRSLRSTWSHSSVQPCAALKPGAAAREQSALEITQGLPAERASGTCEKLKHWMTHWEWFLLGSWLAVRGALD